MTPFVPQRLFFAVSEAKKKAGIYCAAYGCKNRPCAKKRGLCHTHYNRHRQIVDPVQARYEDFKYNALRRKKEFTITLADFRQFCAQNGYLSKGRRGRSATIDRLDNRFGYHIWNIGIKTAIANTSKYWNVDRLLQDHMPGSRYDNEELPF
jgi:hypothetical protein